MSSHEFCTSVSPECPVSATLYGYYPNLSVNSFFVAFFGLLLIAQLILGTATRTYTYMIAVGIGSFGELMGYVGRLIMHKNPWSQTGFDIQICCLVLAPSFLAAGIYLSLKHIVTYCGPEFSRLKPNLYPWIFILSDLSSIIIQAIGGGVAASTNHGANKTLLSAGDGLIITGIALQAVTMGVCGSLMLDYFLRRRKALKSSREAAAEKNAGTESPQEGVLPKSEVDPKRFRIFCWAIGFAFLTILIRCIYRIPEMAGGWGNPRMREETVFLILDGMMVALASLAFTVCHPGFMFPLMRSVKKTNDSSATRKERLWRRS